VKIEFRFVLDTGRKIPVIRTADETVLEHRDLSLLWQRPDGLPGVSSFAHRTGSSKSSILPIPARLAAARPFGPGVETGEVSSERALR
jgi:hypothetical protein